MIASSNKPSHLKALLKKNLILRKRRWCIAILELVIPAAFVAMMATVRAAVPIDDVPQTTYYDQPDWKFSFDGTLTTADEPFLAACPQNFGMIGLIPEGDTLITALKDVFENDLGLKTKYFNNAKEINDFTARGDYGTSDELNLCFAVIVNKNNQDDKYEYSLMFNASGTVGEEDIPKTSAQRIKALSRENLKSLNQYGTNGFLAVQNLIDNLILRQATSDPTATIQSEVTSVTVEAHKTDELAEGMKGQARLYFDIPLLLPYLRMINGIVSEKEKRIREGMKIMGLTNKAFYLSWFITYSIIFTIVSALVSVVATFGIFRLSSFGFVFLWHWEFAMCVMALAFFISIFFNKAKQANVAGFVIAFLLSFFQYLGNGQGASRGALIGCSIPPQASIGLSVDHILSLEATQLGLTSDTVGLEVANYRMTYHYIAMLIDTLVLLILGIYLDQILPSEFGIRKHPLFCLKRKRSLKRRVSQSLDDQNDVLVQPESPENFEETDPTLKIQDSANESVTVQNLRKVYDSKKVAVDGVSFSMYKNQIFSLLGHNGAGKTTTISMITGLFGSTQGTTKVFGMDNQTQIDEIRKIMGVCPQHDILFDDMTVKEHLELYAVFKGVNSKLIRQEVEKTIQDIGLADKKNYLSKNLSGGQKRKLSIGIAFIGGSRFIVLDEPSSGMDTASRRKLWDLLKNYKHNRVILLTTHFMDEADYLGDRIGIMGEGKLKCLGRPLFLKSRFGAGYNLTIVKKDINDPSRPIRDLVLSHVEGLKVLSDISAEISLQLPLEAAPKFQTLFDDLDKNLDKLKISSYGLSATTLEEVFLNVAKIGKELEIEEPQNQNNEDTNLNEFNLRRDGIKGNWNLFKTHFGALVLKRFQYLKRDKRGLLCEIILPIIVVLAGILLSKVEFNPLGSPIPLADNLYSQQFQVGYNAFVPPAGSLVYDNFLGQFNPTTFQLSEKSVTDIAQFDQELYNSQGKDIIKSPINVFGFYMDTFDTTANSYKYTAFINTRAQEGSAFAVNKINNAVLRSTPLNQNKQIIVTVSSFEKTRGTEVTDKIFEGIIFSFIFSMGMSFIPASIITFIVKEREMNAKHQQIVSGVSLMAYWLSNYFVDIIKYLIPAIVNSLLAIAFNAEALIEGDKLGGLWAIFILYGFAVTSFVYLLSFFFKDYGTAQVASFFFNFCTGFIGSVLVSILRLFKGTMDVAKVMHWVLRALPTFSMTYGFINLSNAEAYNALERPNQPLEIFEINLVLGDILCLLGAAFVYFLLVLVVEKLKNLQFLVVMLSRENKVPYLVKEADDDVKKEELEVEQSDNNAYSIKVDKLRKVYNLGFRKYKVAVDRTSFGVRNGECFSLLGVNGAGKTTTFRILSGDYVQTSGNAYINGYSIPSQMEEARKDIGYCPQFDALLEHLTAKEHLYLYAAIKGIPLHLRHSLVEKQIRELNLKQYENIPAGTYSGGNKRKLSVAIAMIGNPSVVFLDEPSTGMDPEARRAMWNVISRISRERKQSSVILTTHSMEEAEALATKMGIMVSGNLKCLGTSQHIKTKFGGGYEIEVKLNLPAQDQINNTLKTFNCESNDYLDWIRVNQILEQVGKSNLSDEISEEGVGSAIHAELKKGKVSAKLVAEWILVESNGDKLKNFLKENFGEMIVLEHFHSFFRFKSTSKFSIGKFFGSLESNKANLDVLQYSIRQSTIEQIFNNFANEAAPEKGQTAIEINGL